MPRRSGAISGGTNGTVAEARHGWKSGFGRVLAIGWLGDDQVVERSGVPPQDEVMLNPFGPLVYALVAMIPVAATGRLAALSSTW
jgi:hypothetical protein